MCPSTSMRYYSGGEDGGDGGGNGYGMLKCSKRRHCPWISSCRCCCCSCWNSVCRTESVRTSSISCWRVTSPEVGGRGGDEVDADALGAEATVEKTRRLRCPRNESENTRSWSAEITALSGRSSLGARKVNLLSLYLTQVSSFHSKPNPTITSSPIPLDGL